MLRFVGVVVIALVYFAQSLMAGTTILLHYGPACPAGSNQARPISATYIDEDTGVVTHVEHTDCAGKRTVGVPSRGVMYHYQAYNTFLHRTNNPSLSPGANNAIGIHLDSAARVEVRDGYSGTLLASYPPSGFPELTQYTVPSSALSGYSGHLIVVDVIKTSNSSYRGTFSVEYP